MISNTLLSVKDASGKAVLTTTTSLQKYSLDVHRLTTGVYFLEIITQNKRKSFQFLKAP